MLLQNAYHELCIGYHQALQGPLPVIASVTQLHWSSKPRLN